MLVQHPTASSSSNGKAGYRTQPVGSSLLHYGGPGLPPVVMSSTPGQPLQNSILHQVPAGPATTKRSQIVKVSKWVPKSDANPLATGSSNWPESANDAEYEGQERVYPKEMLLQALAEVMPKGGFGEKSRGGRPIATSASAEAKRKVSKAQQQKLDEGCDDEFSDAAPKTNAKVAPRPNGGLFGELDPSEPMKIPVSSGLGMLDGTTISPGMGLGAQQAAMSLLRATWQAQLWSPACSPLKGPLMPPTVSPDMLNLDSLEENSAATWGYPDYPYGAPYLHAGAALEPQMTEDSQATTFMLRNIPNKYSRAMLLERLEQLGFKRTFDFLYMPIDFANRCNVGYAFVNFRNQAAANRFLETFNGVETKTCLPGFNSAKICEVTLARMQGLTANVDHLRDSAVMDQLQDHEEWQPLLFDAEGNPVLFPRRRRGSTDDPLDGGSQRGGSRRNSNARNDSKRNTPNLRAQPSPKLSAKASPNLGPQKDPLGDHCGLDLGDGGSSKSKKEKVKKSPSAGPQQDPYGPPSPYIGVSPPPMLNWTPETCTVMLRNIPNKYTRTMLLERLEQLNFKATIDFLYMPIDFANKCNVGYAFVNFRDPYQIPRFLEVFHGVESKTCLPGFNSSKVCEVTAARVQGLNANVAHIRDSTAMRQLANHPEWQPLVFDSNGESIPFLDKSPSLSASAPEFIPSPMLQASAAEFIPEDCVPDFMLEGLADDA